MNDHDETDLAARRAALDAWTWPTQLPVFEDERDATAGRVIDPPPQSSGAGWVLGSDGRMHAQTPLEEVEATGTDYTPAPADPEAEELIAARLAMAEAAPLGLDAVIPAALRLRRAEHASGELDARVVHVRDGLKRESEFVRHTRNRTGEILTQEAEEKSRGQRALLVRQSTNLALALTSENIPAWLPDNAPRASIVDPITEKRIDLQPFRRVNFLPSIAQARRAPMIANLEKFVTRYPDCVFSTFTYGPRVVVPCPPDLTGPLFPPTPEEAATRQALIQESAAIVRAAVAAQHRRISRLNHSENFEKHTFRLHFRATEFGTVEMTDSGLSIHIHTHALGRFSEQPGISAAAEFKKQVWLDWGAHWDFGETVRNIREACKYPVKPGDLEAIPNGGAAILYHALRGMKLVSPIGELREEIRTRYAAGYKLRRWRTEGGPTDGALQLRSRPDWNSRARDMETRAERSRAASRRRLRAQALSRIGYLIAAEAMRLATLARNTSLAAFAASIATKRRKTRLTKAQLALKQARHCLSFRAMASFWLNLTPRPGPELEAAQKAQEAAEAKAARAKIPCQFRNRIVARLGAANYFDRISRPGLFVWQFDGDFAKLREEQFLTDYLATAKPLIEAAQAALPEHDAEEARKRARSEFVHQAEEDAKNPPGLLNRVHTSHTTAGAS